MEDNLKVFKVEYIRTHLLDLPWPLNLSLGDQTKIDFFLKWRRPPMEDNLIILKVEYLSNHLSQINLSYLPQIWNLSLGDQTKIENCLR